MKLPPMSNEERRLLASPLTLLVLGFVFVVYTLPTLYAAVQVARGKIPVSWFMLCWGGGVTAVALVMFRWHRQARKETP